ncbi:hypothetical protein ACOME3_000983 [Neoechinorhynchus agilis]
MSLQILENNMPRQNAWGDISISEIARLAISNAPNRTLPLQKIYDYFKQNYPYFAAITDEEGVKNWQNYVRHKLSASNKFTLVRVSQGPNGMHWAINGGNKDGRLRNRDEFQAKNLTYDGAVPNDVAAGGNGAAVMAPYAQGNFYNPNVLGHFQQNLGPITNANAFQNQNIQQLAGNTGHFYGTQQMQQPNPMMTAQNFIKGNGNPQNIYHNPALQNIGTLQNAQDPSGVHNYGTQMNNQQQPAQYQQQWQQEQQPPTERLNLGNSGQNIHPTLMANPVRMISGTDRQNMATAGYYPQHQIVAPNQNADVNNRFSREQQGYSMPLQGQQAACAPFTDQQNMATASYNPQHQIAAPNQNADVNNTVSREQQGFTMHLQGQQAVCAPFTDQQNMAAAGFYQQNQVVAPNQNADVNNRVAREQQGYSMHLQGQQAACAPFTDQQSMAAAGFHQQHQVVAHNQSADVNNRALREKQGYSMHLQGQQAACAPFTDQQNMAAAGFNQQHQIAAPNQNPDVNNRVQREKQGYSMNLQGQQGVCAPFTDQQNMVTAGYYPQHQIAAPNQNADVNNRVSREQQGYSMNLQGQQGVCAPFNDQQNMAAAGFHQQHQIAAPNQNADVNNRVSREQQGYSMNLQGQQGVCAPFNDQQNMAAAGFHQQHQIAAPNQNADVNNRVSREQQGYSMNLQGQQGVCAPFNDQQNMAAAGFHQQHQIAAPNQNADVNNRVSREQQGYSMNLQGQQGVCAPFNDQQNMAAAGFHQQHQIAAPNQNADVNNRVPREQQGYSMNLQGQQATCAPLTDQQTMAAAGFYQQYQVMAPNSNPDVNSRVQREQQGYSMNLQGQQMPCTPASDQQNMAAAGFYQQNQVVAPNQNADANNRVQREQQGYSMHLQTKQMPCAPATDQQSMATAGIHQQHQIAGPHRNTDVNNRVPSEQEGYSMNSRGQQAAYAPVTNPQNMTAAGFYQQHKIAEPNQNIGVNNEVPREQQGYSMHLQAQQAVCAQFTDQQTTTAASFYQKRQIVAPNQNTEVNNEVPREQRGYSINLPAEQAVCARITEHQNMATARFYQQNETAAPNQNIEVNNEDHREQQGYSMHLQDQQAACAPITEPKNMATVGFYQQNEIAAQNPNTGVNNEVQREQQGYSMHLQDQQAACAPITEPQNMATVGFYQQHEIAAPNQNTEVNNEDQREQQGYSMHLQDEQAACAPITEPQNMATVGFYQQHEIAAPNQNTEVNNEDQREQQGYSMHLQDEQAACAPITEPQNMATVGFYQQHEIAAPNQNTEVNNEDQREQQGYSMHLQDEQAACAPITEPQNMATVGFYQQHEIAAPNQNTEVNNEDQREQQGYSMHLQDEQAACAPITEPQNMATVGFYQQHEIAAPNQNTEVNNEDQREQQGYSMHLQDQQAACAPISEPQNMATVGFYQQTEIAAPNPNTGVNNEVPREQQGYSMHLQDQQAACAPVTNPQNMTAAGFYQQTEITAPNPNTEVNNEDPREQQGYSMHLQDQQAACAPITELQNMATVGFHQQYEIAAPHPNTEVNNEDPREQQGYSMHLQDQQAACAPITEPQNMATVGFYQETEIAAPNPNTWVNNEVQREQQGYSMYLQDQQAARAPVTNPQNMTAAGFYQQTEITAPNPNTGVNNEDPREQQGYSINLQGQQAACAPISEPQNMATVGFYQQTEIAAQNLNTEVNNEDQREQQGYSMHLQGQQAAYAPVTDPQNITTAHFYQQHEIAAPNQNTEVKNEVPREQQGYSMNCASMINKDGDDRSASGQKRFNQNSITAMKRQYEGTDNYKELSKMQKINCTQRENMTGVQNYQGADLSSNKVTDETAKSNEQMCEQKSIRSHQIFSDKQSTKRTHDVSECHPPKKQKMCPEPNIEAEIKGAHESNQRNFSDKVGLNDEDYQENFRLLNEQKSHLTGERLENNQIRAENETRSAAELQLDDTVNLHDEQRGTIFNTLSADRYEIANEDLDRYRRPNVEHEHYFSFEAPDNDRDNFNFSPDVNFGPINQQEPQTEHHQQYHKINEQFESEQHIPIPVGVETKDQFNGSSQFDEATLAQYILEYPRSIEELNLSSSASATSPAESYMSVDANQTVNMFLENILFRPCTPEGEQSEEEDYSEGGEMTPQSVREELPPSEPPAEVIRKPKDAETLQLEDAIRAALGIADSPRKNDNTEEDQENDATNNTNGNPEESQFDSDEDSDEDNLLNQILSDD